MSWRTFVNHLFNNKYLGRQRAKAWRHVMILQVDSFPPEKRDMLRYRVIENDQPLWDECTCFACRVIRRQMFQPLNQRHGPGGGGQCEVISHVEKRHRNQRGWKLRISASQRRFAATSLPPSKTVEITEHLWSAASKMRVRQPPDDLTPADSAARDFPRDEACCVNITSVTRNATAVCEPYRAHDCSP